MSAGTTPSDSDLQAAPQGNPSPNPPCASCKGRCCRTYFVPLGGRDMWRITRKQRLAPEQFVQVVSTGETQDDNFYLNSEGPSYCMTLDKKGKFDRYQPCVFLMEMPGCERCGIYEHRPAACRVYPMKMNWGRVSLSDHAICPPEEWAPEEILRPAWQQALRRSYMEYDIYVEVVARWNARVALHAGVEFAGAEYLSYVVNVYDRLNIMAEETGAEEIARLERLWPGPPRGRVAMDELMLCRGDIPWLDYLSRAREIIDRFYPEVTPQPMHVPLSVD